MAPRSIWKGSIGFGMVSVPVKLYGSVDEQAVRFNQLHSGCDARVKQDKVCTGCDQKVESADIVKGYDIGGDQFVIVQPDELAALSVKSLKAIDIVEFVEAGDIDPRHFNKPYFLAPDPAGAKAFALLLRGMEKVGRAGVAKLTMREREHLCVIRPFNDVLLLQTMYRADELRDDGEVAVDLPDVSDQEQDMAVTLIETMNAGVDMSKFPDDYRQAVLDLIEAKLNGTTIQVAPVEEAKPTEDVLAGLLASVEAAKAAKVAA